MNITTKQLKNIADTVYESVKQKQAIPVFQSVNRYQLPYVLAKGVLNPTKTIVVDDIKAYNNPQWTYISRDVPKDDYLDMAGRLVDYVNKNRKLPNYTNYKGYKVSTAVYTYCFACIYKFYHIKGRYPAYWTFNNKAFTKPTETTNVVYDYFVQKTNYKPTTMDNFLQYIANNYTYQYYYDDYKSNKEVIDTESGNCTDLLQMMINVLIKLGYEYVVLHVLCSGGDGHVRAKFRHKTNTDNQWVYRDIACVASSGNITCNWCTTNYTLLDTNPSWFMENLNR